MTEEERAATQLSLKVSLYDDLEVDVRDARVAAIIVFGRPRFFGLFGKGNDCIIPWRNISLIGEDTILVDYSVQKMTNKAKKCHKFVTFCN